MVMNTGYFSKDLSSIQTQYLHSHTGRESFCMSVCLGLDLTASLVLQGHHTHDVETWVQIPTHIKFYKRETAIDKNSGIQLILLPGETESKISMQLITVFFLILPFS